MKNTTIIKRSNFYLTGATATGDQYPGVSVQGYANQPNQFQGQLGAVMELNFGAAGAVSDPASTTLQGGEYQYVQFYASGTNYAVGQVLYWYDETKYIVSNVAPTTVSARVAGFCLSPVAQGYYWFVQTTGVAWALYKSSPTDLTADDGVYVVVNTNTVDALADGTADATSGVNKLFVGIAKDTPVSAVIKRIYITNIVRVS